MQHWQHNCQLHDIWLAEGVHVEVPVGTLEVQLVDVSSVFRLLLDFIWWSIHGSELELQLIDRSRVGFTSILLQQGCGETLREGESTKPEDERCSLGSPKVEELVSLTKIIEPVGQGFHGEVTITPGGWHTVVINAIDDVLKVRSNGLKTFETLLKLSKIGSEQLKDNLVSLAFLLEHDIHRVLTVRLDLLLEHEPVD